MRPLEPALGGKAPSNVGVLSLASDCAKDEDLMRSVRTSETQFFSVASCRWLIRTDRARAQQGMGRLKHPGMFFLLEPDDLDMVCAPTSMV
jgi:hypothetical protein